MNAYLFTAGITQSQLRPTQLGQGQTAYGLRTWDACVSMIVCGDNPDEAQKLFETWLHRVPEGENPVQVEIKKLVAAQFMEQLLTESGREPIDWMQIPQRIDPTLQLAEGDDLEQQGYWADVNSLIRPPKLSSDIESLRHDLPEGIRAGLNWSAEKQFFFIVSVLSPPTPAAEPVYELEPDVANADIVRDEDSTETQPAGLDAVEAALPELREKEVAALVQARNSAVAAWLWRRFAAETPFAANDIDIDPWCGLISVEMGGVGKG